MSGVFGIVSREGQTGDEDLLARMGRAMSHRPWYQVDARYDPAQGTGLGRVGIGIFNAEPQPVVSADGRLWACMAGEFYDVGQIRQDLHRKGYACLGSASFGGGGISAMSLPSMSTFSPIRWAMSLTLSV